MQIHNLLEAVALILLHSNIGIYLYDTEGARARQHDVQRQQQESQPEPHAASLETGRGSGHWIGLDFREYFGSQVPIRDTNYIESR
jgi:hypothetical protein